jgi:hypothetical protein
LKIRFLCNLTQDIIDILIWSVVTFASKVKQLGEVGKPIWLGRDVRLISMILAF